VTQLLLCPDIEISPSITLTENGSCFETIWEDGGLIIQDKFNKIFEDAGIKGVKFIVPERWDGYSGEKKDK